MPNITHNLLLGLSTGDCLINLVIIIPEPEVFYKSIGNSNFQVKKERHLNILRLMWLMVSTILLCWTINIKKIIQIYLPIIASRYVIINYLVRIHAELFLECNNLL